MKSFELYDTLITRSCKKEDILDYIENHYPYPDFKTIRIKAETIALEKYNNTISLDHIYEVIKEIKPEEESLDLLKEYEFTIEQEYSIPILCNINLIETDDIFIVDSYFTKSQIIQLLNKHEIIEKPIFFITDKNIPETETHIGKNIKRKNLKITNAHAFTSTELLLYHTPIQKRIRTFRLKNPYPEETDDYKKYHQQTCYSFPILLLFSLHIEKIMKQENRNKILFCKNGIYQLFTILFPTIESVLFSTSHLIHLQPTLSYKEYTQKLYQDKNTLIVDLQDFFHKDGFLYKEIFGCMPRVHLLLQERSSFPYLSSSIENTEISKEYIRSLYYDSRGDLFSMIEGTELRLQEKSSGLSTELLLSFSKEFYEMEIKELNIQSILLKIIENACVK